MCRKIVSLVVSAALLVLLAGNAASVGPKEEKSRKDVQKIRDGILKLGTGPAARVEVRLRDKTKLKGYVDQVAEDHFVVIDDNSGAATKVAYPQVKKVKGNNLSTGAKIAIGIGIFALVVYLVFLAEEKYERPPH